MASTTIGARSDNVPARLTPRCRTVSTDTMKIGDNWTSETTPRGFRVRVDLPAGLVVTIQERVAAALAPEGKITGHASVWRLHGQVVVFFPTSRSDAERLLGIVFDHFDPELKQNLDKITSWINDLPESGEVPSIGQGSLN